jgi:hypothetical protein
MSRSLRERIHNPLNWTCNCDPSCWCNTTRWGRALMWYIPPRFHRFRRRTDRCLGAPAQAAPVRP